MVMLKCGDAVRLNPDAPKNAKREWDEWAKECRDYDGYTLYLMDDCIIGKEANGKGV